VRARWRHAAAVTASSSPARLWLDLGNKWLGGAAMGVNGGDGVLKWPVVARDRELTVEAAMTMAAQLRHARARASSAHFIGGGGCKCNQAPKWVLVMLTT
jgi:hypothetical protein